MVQWPIGRERKQNPQPEPWLAARGNKRPLWRQWEDKMKKKMLSLLLCGCLAASALAGCGKASEEEVVTNTDAEDAAEEPGHCCLECCLPWPSAQRAEFSISVC